MQLPAQPIGWTHADGALGASQLNILDARLCAGVGEDCEAALSLSSKTEQTFIDPNARFAEHHCKLGSVAQLLEPNFRGK